MVTDAELVQFCCDVETLIVLHDRKTMPKLVSQPGYVQTRVYYDHGPKYTRIVKEWQGQRSVFCFVDNATGDILKADGWKRPAKHARGHIKNGAADVGPYGPAYLNGPAHLR